MMYMNVSGCMRDTRYVNVSGYRGNMCHVSYVRGLGYGCDRSYE